VLDLDLADVMLPATLAALEAALVKHEALVLHVPELTLAQHLAIAQHFGEPEVHTFYPNLGPGYEQITLIDSKLGDRADMWHHDESFLPSPPIVTMTHAKILPPCGGDTCWISMTTAYDALSGRMKQYLDGLMAWHDMNGPMTTALRQNVVTHDRYLEVIKMGRRHLHPVVSTHPITGRKALNISPTYTTHVDGLAPAESDAVLAYLHAHCQHVQFVYRHRWTVGDMVLWDNRSVIHNAILDYLPHQRRMQRASVFARKVSPT
jgi:taurine dioxygenase